MNQKADVVEAVLVLRRVLAGIEAGELAASAGTVRRLEGALAALCAIAGLPPDSPGTEGLQETPV